MAELQELPAEGLPKGWDDIEKIIAGCQQPPPRPATIFRVMALVTSDIEAGKPFPHARSIARRLQRHETHIGKQLWLLESLGYIQKEGRIWQLSADRSWLPSKETYAEMIALYFILKRPWRPIRVGYRNNEEK